MELNVMHDPQFSSLLAPKDSGLNNYAFQNSVKYRQAVRVRRLDDVVAETPDLSRSALGLPQARARRASISKC